MKDLTAQTFGRLFVLHQVPNVNGRVSWRCICECNALKITDSKSLVTGKTASCGCIRVKHGLAKTPLHKVWLSMRERCNNPKARSYKHYGARGIRVCDRWSNFELFLEDMGERPPKHSIERMDNNGNYEPSNCRWATALEQASNTTRTRLLTAYGRTMTQAAWARELGTDSSVLIGRLRLGWSEEKTCTTPVWR